MRRFLPDVVTEPVLRTLRSWSNTAVKNKRGIFRDRHVGNLLQERRRVEPGKISQLHV